MATGADESIAISAGFMLVVTEDFVGAAMVQDLRAICLHFYHSNGVRCRSGHANRRCASPAEGRLGRLTIGLQVDNVDNLPHYYSTIACITAFSKSLCTDAICVWIMTMVTIFSRGSIHVCVP